jgi:hypothetical protein
MTSAVVIVPLTAKLVPVVKKNPGLYLEENPHLEVVISSILSLVVWVCNSEVG